MTGTSSNLRDELMACERAYLEAVQRKDGEAAARMTAPESLVVSGHGAMSVDGAAIRKMVEDHDGQARYEIDDSDVNVVAINDDVAIVSYRLTTIHGNGEPATQAFDTDVWVRRDGQWGCALHVDTPALT